MKAGATALDVAAVRVSFALKAEEWFVDQFSDLGYSVAHLKRYLEQPAKAPKDRTPRHIFDRLLTNEERERLSAYLTEVRKSKGANVRLDGKPRRRADGCMVWPDGTIEAPPMPGPGR